MFQRWVGPVCCQCGTGWIIMSSISPDLDILTLQLLLVYPSPYIKCEGYLYSYTNLFIGEKVRWLGSPWAGLNQVTWIMHCEIYINLWICFWLILYGWDVCRYVLLNFMNPQILHLQFKFSRFTRIKFYEFALCGWSLQN